MPEVHFKTIKYSSCFWKLYLKIQIKKNILHINLTFKFSRFILGEKISIYI